MNFLGNNTKDNFFLLWQTIGPFRGHAFLILIMLVVLACVEGIGLAMFMPLLEAIISTESNSFWMNLLSPIKNYVGDNYFLFAICGLLLFFMVLKNVLLAFKVYYVNFFSFGLNRLLANKIYKNYMYAPHSFLAKNKKGALLNNLLVETVNASKGLNSMLFFMAELLMAIALFSILCLTHWKMTLISMSVLATFALLFQKVTRHYSLKYGRDRLDTLQSLNSQVSESLDGITEVKAFSIENLFVRWFKEKFLRYVSMIINFQFLQALAMPIGEILIVTILISGIIFLKWQDHDLKNYLPLIGLFLVVTQKLTKHIMTLVSKRMNIFSFFPAISLIYQLSEKDEEKESNTSTKLVPVLKNNIFIDNIHFSFSKTEDPLFSNLSVEIPVNKTTAFVGPSGVGKSTLISLVMGFLKVQKGNILIDGEPLESFNQHSWRSKVGFVSQSPFIFNMDVSENIAIGKDGATKKEIVQAAKSAYAHEFILNMQKGYETQLGEDAVKLSGGQRHRIAVARALIRDPEILLLDEITSALDKESEEKIRQSIRSLRGKKTIVLITHNKSFADDADVIYDLAQLISIKK